MPLIVLTILCAIFACPMAAQAAIAIVAGENVYSEVAGQLAGEHATVTSILNNPDQDPHLFEASPSVARRLATAAIVVCNGADYDPWMTKLLTATNSADRSIIVVADLVHWRPGHNPHLWYDPATMPIYATALVARLSERDPARKSDYDQRLQAFLASLQPLDARIAALRGRHGGAAVTATEPVFGYMATALGFVMRNERFQLAIMNNIEPRASDVAAIENDLRGRSVRLLLYNRQATDATAQRLVRMAERSKVPVVGVTETEPIGKTYQEWMMSELDAIDQALSGRTP